MRFEVVLTADAVHDLDVIADWIAMHESPSKAEHVIERIEAAVLALANYPERGPHPKELLDLGIRDYRQTFFKPYRIIYGVTRTQVHVYLIADGRRDMRSLLSRRLLGG